MPLSVDIPFVSPRRLSNFTHNIRRRRLAKFKSKDVQREFDAQEDAKFHKQGKSPACAPMEGQILKFTNVVKGFQYRYFVLDPDSGMLEYFEKEEHKKQRPRGSVHLAAAVVSPSEEDSQTFIVSAGNGEVFKLRAADARTRQLWVDRIRSTAEHHTSNLSQLPPPNLNLTPKSTSSLSGQTRRKESLRRTRGSHESLPISKKSPRNGSFQELQEYFMEAEDFSKHLDDKISALPSSGEYMNALDADLLLLKATSAATLHCIQDCINILQVTEGSEDSPRSQTSIEKMQVQATALRLTEGTKDRAESLPSADEEVPDEEAFHAQELGGVEEHKSVILHLLSQLKLGMDLTKVVLPTFILERRSLLEMFADCMAHPDAFLKIPEIEDPEGRMLAVLEWYLTSFHNGRQSSVAKKPYNPIIGETFHCSWHVDETSSEDKAGQEEEKTDAGDKKTHLTYTAEQVSHHPPVSAFYFECPSRKMKMNASIYTKSKFMGMSIGVVMVGKIHLRLESHDEDYVFGLPSAYARSILTVPWVELGDKVPMVCEKSGYTANIVFHTKPFYGGKLHHTTAEVKNVKTGEICCKVQGEWDSSLEFSYSNGTTKTVDVSTLPISGKFVRPIDQQGEHESRRLWQHVTNALKTNDINTATEHKRMLEEIQREGERHRKDLNIEYTAKHFKKVNGSWIYHSLPDSFEGEPKK
ncbi:oxysterol-binding protein-related protein 11 [Aplysia californica]|uniref:Oxysterol-binding protein n=1 Tax=Aplysia californica TaxID=6500 RepID=A0ABM0ZW79_APLCA|nr:oxysterol-binding protein-related protein 11 [Aplysia californica]